MEMMYQYIWRSGALGRHFTLEDGRYAELLSPGILNTDAGPDFSAARLIIDGVQWAGNIEIHVKASDWYRHRHQTDPAYDNIILHVVGIPDAQICRSDGTPVPTLVIPASEEVVGIYNSLTAPSGKIRCSARVASVPRLVSEDWFESVALERLAQKAGRILEEYRHLAGDWEQTCFVLLARGMGFGINAEPFEILARNIPLRIIHHHSDNPFQLEALLLGQAGLLDPSIRIFDEYYQQLCREYYFLARKYSLRPMPPQLWKYARTRPQNFPHRRIVLLCKALESGFAIARRILDCADDIDELRKLFDWHLSGFWHTHFSFDTPALKVSDCLGEASVNSLLINVVAPYLYAYSIQSGNPVYGERAINLLESLPAERNTLVRQWESLGFHAHNALRSQAFIQLCKCWCDAGRCLECRFGHNLIGRLVREETGAYGVSRVIGNQAREDEALFGTALIDDYYS